jgi:hypothetical protein
LGAPHLPTFPCEHQQSAIPYVAMVVFSCNRASVSADTLKDGDADGD